jgi:hypothetical protein
VNANWATTRCFPNVGGAFRDSAQELAEELEVRSRRQLDGLEPLAPSDGGSTVHELLCWWLQN